jgi:predicted O-methyltransferase YrrM
VDLVNIPINPVEITLSGIVKRFNVDLLQEKMPIEIPNKARYSLAYLYRDLSFRIGVEVGVETGGYSWWMCKHCPGLKVYCVDPWMAYGNYRRHVTQEQQDGFYETAKKRLENFDCTLIRKFSLDAVRDFEDNSLDFVFIDGNHDFQNCTNDIHEWMKKVRVGGIVAGHDYIIADHYKDAHVAYVVDGYTKAYRINPWFLLGGKQKTWMWIKTETPKLYMRN